MRLRSGARKIKEIKRKILGLSDQLVLFVQFYTVYAKKQYGNINYGKKTATSAVDKHLLYTLFMHNIQKIYTPNA